jgi:peptide chain release factor 1
MKKESIVLEIRASEGGSDSKLIVEDMMNIYLKSARVNSFESKVLERRDGYASIQFIGKGSKSYYGNEGGGHRFIRIPPTEKRGRTQTSIVTIAVIDPEYQLQFQFDRSKVIRKCIRSSGKGGQNVNKTSSCVQLTHTPSGIQVKCQDTRDQCKNEEIAWDRLYQRVKNIEEKKHDKSVYDDRFSQVGNSSRSQKRRTYRVKDDIVIDHLTNKETSYKNISRGKLELLS